ncbi:MAG: acyloxyacyl hydrolase [Bacteroidota bacterium]
MANSKAFLKLTSCLVIACVCLTAQAQENPEAIQPDARLSQRINELSFRCYGGFLMAHRPSMVYLQNAHSASIEIDYLWRCSGSASWHKAYRFPSVGVSYRLTSFGNPDLVGDGHSISVATEFPLSSGTKFSIRTRGSFGIGWIERPFDVRDNYKNLAAGSHLNGVVGFGISGGIHIGKSSTLNTGIHFLHFSNGSARTPNLGLNVPSLSISYTRIFSRTLSSPRTLQGPADFSHNNLYLATGIKEIYPPSGKSYPVAVIDYSRTYLRGKKGVLGCGLSFMYDSSLPTKVQRENNSESNDQSDAIRIGTYGSAGLRMGPWSANLQVGLYLYNRVKSDGDVFNRLSLRHQRPNGLFYCINLKSHFGKADYIEWGIGKSF